MGNLSQNRVGLSRKPDSGHFIQLFLFKFLLFSYEVRLCLCPQLLKAFSEPPQLQDFGDLLPLLQFELSGLLFKFPYQIVRCLRMSQEKLLLAQTLTRGLAAELLDYVLQYSLFYEQLTAFLRQFFGEPAQLG